MNSPSCHWSPMKGSGNATGGRGVQMDVPRHGEDPRGFGLRWSRLEVHPEFKSCMKGAEDLVMSSSLP